MPDVLFRINPNHPTILALPPMQRRHIQFDVSGEIEKMNFVGSGSHSFMEFIVNWSGLTVQDYKWINLSGFYKTRIADLVYKEFIIASVQGIPVPFDLIPKAFEPDWVLQETLLAGASNVAPTVADEGIDIQTFSAVAMHIEPDVGMTFDWQLYEFVLGAGWAAVVGFNGVAQTNEIVLTYPNPNSADRLYLRVFNVAGLNDIDLAIGRVTPNYIMMYDRALAAVDPPPTGDDGIDTVGRTRLGFAVEFTSPGAVDVTLWGRIGGVWGLVRYGAFPGIAANFEDWFGLDETYERMFLQLSNFVGGATCTRTLKALTV